jgi:hypothetical protein
MRPNCPHTARSRALEESMKDERLKKLEEDLERQNEELAELEEALRHLEAIPVPFTFIADFEEATEVRPASNISASSVLPTGVRA